MAALWRGADLVQGLEEALFLPLLKIMPVRFQHCSR
jgi:hypothetical protein